MSRDAAGTERWGGGGGSGLFLKSPLSVTGYYGKRETDPCVCEQNRERGREEERENMSIYGTVCHSAFFHLSFPCVYVAEGRSHSADSCN